MRSAANRHRLDSEAYRLRRGSAPLAGRRPLLGLLLRSPVLEDAERSIAARPSGAPAPTEETQAFIVESRHGATRRRDILTGSLAAGLVLALALAGLAYWQRGIAVEQRKSRSSSATTRCCGSRNI